MAHATATAPANEGFFAHLFNPAGRTNRAKYWLAILAYLLIYAAVVALYFLLEQQAMGVVGLVIGSIVFVVLTVSSILIAIRRLHDRDKSGHWLWLFYLVPGILSGVGSALQMVSPEAAILALVPTLVSVGISIWALVELGFLPGTRGSNRFGPDPLLA